MPRREDQRWDSVIFEFTKEHPKAGPARARDFLAKRAAESGHDESELPSERTIARRQAWFREQPESFQRPFALVYWPETFERGDVPWEAAPVVLEWMRKEWPGRLPVRFALWIWRVAQVAPHALDADGIDNVAMLLSTAKGPSASSARRWVERLLVTADIEGALAAGFSFPTADIDEDMLAELTGEPDWGMAE